VIDVDRLAPLSPNAALRFAVVSRLLPPDVKDVLDVGCGQGSIGVRLAQRYSYLGLEPDPSSFAMASHRIGETGLGEVRNARVEDLGDDAKFDLVTAFEVIEHIEDDAAALAAWSSRLRPGGWVLLSVPAYQRRYSYADELVGHFRRYDPPAMETLLRDGGFTDVTLRQYGMPLGYLLEAARNRMGKRRLAATQQTSVEDRTAASGRTFQPQSAVKGLVTRWGTAPFRAVQHAFPRTGPGLVARARLR